MTLRRHPVFQVIQAAAYQGRAGLPTKAELDRLELPDAARRRVHVEARAAAAIHETGDRQSAWAAAEEAAAEIISDLDEPLRDADYLHTDPLADVDDPVELAARIPRP